MGTSGEMDILSLIHISIHEGIDLARRAVQSGRALETLNAFVQFTQSVDRVTRERA